MDSSILIFIVGFILGGCLLWFIRQKEIESIRGSQEYLKNAFGNLSKEALDSNIDTFLSIAESKFSDLIKTSDNQLTKKKDLIDLTLKDMKTDLKSLSTNTIQLKAQMDESKKTIDGLSESTGKLRQILSSSQARGNWGERMVEDILNFIGLKEGINFLKQTQIDSDRPDFTFLLPDKKIINMDVKFPLAHYEKYLEEENVSTKELEKKAFLKDVRNRVKEVSKRSYINPEKGTVDYVLLFIPNESIFSFLNQEDHQLIDFSLERKIMLCSPITLYAVLSLIRQAVSNFSIEQKANEMQSQVGIFIKQWGLYTEKLEALGKTLGTVSSHYNDLRETRMRALQKPIDKISELRLGNEREDNKIE